MNTEKTSRQYPRELMKIARTGKVWDDEPQAWVSDPPPSPNPKDCTNCSGWGIMTVFVAVKGPFETTGYSDGEHSNHYDEVRQKWWVGKVYSFPCPVCDGPVSFAPSGEPEPMQIAYEVAGKLNAR